VTLTRFQPTDHAGKFSGMRRLMSGSPDGVATSLLQVSDYTEQRPDRMVAGPPWRGTHVAQW
jgi:hypothetical protein